MIETIRGRLIKRLPSYALIDVGGLGFKVNIPFSTYQELPEEGREAHLQTILQIKEENVNLYGFHTKEEKEMFLLLLGISGIGAKTSLTILSGITIREFIQAVVSGNEAMLRKIPGVGKKTAARIVVELKDRFSPEEKPSKAAEGGQTLPSGAASDAYLALVSLGYNGAQAKNAVEKALAETSGRSTSLEELLKTAFRHLL